MNTNDAIARSFSNVRNDMEAMRRSILELRKENHFLKAKLEELENSRKSRAQKKDYVGIVSHKPVRNTIKDKMLDLIDSSAMTLSGLKEEIVDRQDLCSKATFYRYFEELRMDNLVEMAMDDRRKILKSKRIQLSVVE